MKTPYSLPTPGQADKPNPREQLYRALQNWAEFGLWLSGGLFATFAAREIPALRPFYGLAVAGVLLFLYFVNRRESKPEAIAVALALGLALLGGTWDYAWDLILRLLPLLP